MPIPPPRLFFDYVDPCSWIVERRLCAVEAELGIEAARHPLELVVPPEPLLDPVGEAFSDRWERAREAARKDGIELRRPDFVPWSRKAHELVLHAREQGAGREVHYAVFRAFHEEGRDIGRVDVLVELAGGAGLDLTGAKAVLDVDRHLETLRRLRRIAERLEVPGVPTVLAGARAIGGVPDATTLRSALAGRPPAEPQERATDPRNPTDR